MKRGASRKACSLPGISVSELSRRLGRSRAAILKLARAGKIPRLPDGSFDEQSVRAAYLRNADPRQRKPLRPAEGVEVATPVPPPLASLEEAREAVSLVRRVLAEEGRLAEDPPSLDDVRSAETILRARKHAQEIAVARGDLIRKAPVLRQIEEAFGAMRKELQALPARYGAQIAAEVGCEATAMDAALSKAIREFLGCLSEH